MVDSTTQYPPRRDPSVPHSEPQAQAKADLVRGQEPFDPSLSIGSTINENLGVPIDLGDNLAAEEAALQVTDDGLYAQELEGIDHLGQDADQSDLTQDFSPPQQEEASPSRMAARVQSKIPEIKDRLGQLRGRAQDGFQAHPYTYMIGAVGLGYVLGKMIGSPRA